MIFFFVKAILSFFAAILIIVAALFIICNILSLAALIILLFFCWLESLFNLIKIQLKTFLSINKHKPNAQSSRLMYFKKR